MILMFVLLHVLTLSLWDRMLKTFGCTCLEAEDGDDSIRQYVECVESGDTIYDLVLMDFIMPSKYTKPCIGFAYHVLLTAATKKCTGRKRLSSFGRLATMAL